MATIGDVEGIDPKSATRLRKAGVRTTEGLIKVASTAKGRKVLAEKTAIPAPTLLAWVNRADLMRIKGIGSEYADLLETAGCDTVKALRRRNPASLTATMVDMNEQKRLVRRLPTEAMVVSWIDQAKTMNSVVKH